MGNACAEEIAWKILPRYISLENYGWEMFELNR